MIKNLEQGTCAQRFVGITLTMIFIDLYQMVIQALFTRIWIIIIPFYPKNVPQIGNSIHKYLDRLPILFTRSQIQFLSGQTLCGQALHLYLSIPILYLDRLFTCVYAWRIVHWIDLCSAFKGKRCECKAYLHRVYPDRNRIWLRVNGTSVMYLQHVGQQS